jgi:hypothetical protein
LKADDEVHVVEPPLEKPVHLKCEWKIHPPKREHHQEFEHGMPNPEIVFCSRLCLPFIAFRNGLVPKLVSFP